jgi:biotin carboxyl carrier protein
MPGTVVKCYVTKGQLVKPGEALISVESMKMEFIIRASTEVIVKDIIAKEG